MRRLDECPYRHAAGAPFAGEDAVCRFLQQLTGITDESACVVGVDACRLCCAHSEPAAGRLNPVVASLLYGLAGSARGLAPAHAAPVRAAAESALAADGSVDDDWIRFLTVGDATRGDTRAACDAIICCTEASERAERVIRSVLGQRDVTVFVQLVDDGGGSELLSRYGGRSNVFTRRNPAPRGLFRTLHDCVPALRSEFVAVQHPATISRPRRLADAVALLVEHGADLLAAALQVPAGTERPLHPGGGYRRTLPPETLVFRRAALVDMCGVADRPEDADVEIIHRAVSKRRLVLLCDSVTVESDVPLLGRSPLPRRAILTATERSSTIP
jgi:hypothetical protein